MTKTLIQKRIEFRSLRNGWAQVLIKTGYGETRETLESFKVRNGADALVKLADKMKAEGYQSVGWGAVGTGYWIGETFQPDAK